MIRPATADDVTWMADLLEIRRREHAGWSPVFWRPAAGARAAHEPFLASLVASDAVVALRDDHGFVLADRDGDRCTIDDFAVDDPDRWPTHGHLLLVAAWRLQHERGAKTARVATAHRDVPKRTMLLDAGLAVAEEWWVKPLVPAAGAATTFGPLPVDGAEVVLVPAPPVYDPGGPVALLPPGTDHALLPTVERRAAEAGAVLAVARLDDGADRAGVEAAGYEPTSAFLEGEPG